MTTASERRQRRQTVLHTLPLAFTMDREAMMAIGQAHGRQGGLDHDWVPPRLDDAIFESLLAGDPSVQAAKPGAPFYPFQILLAYDRPTMLAALEEEGLLEGGDVDRALVAALQMDLSPVDLGFEIEGLVPPASAHADLDRARLYAAAVLAVDA